MGSSHMRHRVGVTSVVKVSTLKAGGSQRRVTLTGQEDHGSQGQPVYIAAVVAGVGVGAVLGGSYTVLVMVAVPALGDVIPYEQRPMPAVAVDHVAHGAALAVGYASTLPMAVQLAIAVLERYSLGYVRTGLPAIDTNVAGAGLHVSVVVRHCVVSFRVLCTANVRQVRLIRRRITP